MNNSAGQHYSELTRDITMISARFLISSLYVLARITPSSQKGNIGLDICLKQFRIHLFPDCKKTVCVCAETSPVSKHDVSVFSIHIMHISRAKFK